jgi:hypothetical protein
LAPYFLSVCSSIGSIHWSPLLSIGKVPGGMEDQLSTLGHQRKFNFVHSIGYLVVVVVYPVEEKDHWDIELGKIVMVRTVVKTIGIVCCIVSVI